jgi:hypothetical protein
MSREVSIEGKTHTLFDVLGEGGEAVVYTLDTDRVAKIHHQAFDERKIEALMKAQLPSCLVRPQALVFANSGKAIGYVMERIEGEPLAAFTRREARARGFSSNDAVALIEKIAQDLDAIHQCGIIVSDLNDMNVLVCGSETRWIDVDSYAFAGFPASAFSERYLDPRLMNAHGGIARAQDPASDVYALCALAIELLFFMGPYAGVHAPQAGGKPLTPIQRMIARCSIFSSEVKLPRAAPPLSIVSEAVREGLREIIEGTRREWSPLSLRFVRCAGCGEEHAVASCPWCRTQVAAAQVVGRVKVVIVPMPVSVGARRAVLVGEQMYVVDADALTTEAVSSARGGREMRGGALLVGRVMEGRTTLFQGTTFGLALMRLSTVESGSLTLGAVFSLHRAGMNDGLRFPQVRGRVRDMHAVFSEDHGWLSYVREERGRWLRGVYLFDARGRHIAHTEKEEGEETWLDAVRGACASGAGLFVPSDEGIVRVEAQNRSLIATSVFTDTAPYLDASATLMCTRDGIAVVDANTHTLRVLSLETKS